MNVISAKKLILSGCSRLDVFVTVLDFCALLAIFTLEQRAVKASHQGNKAISTLSYYH